MTKAMNEMKNRRSAGAKAAAMILAVVIMAVIIARKADKQYAEQTKKDPARKTQGF